MTATTNTAQGLLADIIEHPEADDLRLIYADWLDDHDEEERAEFIRVQVELAKAELRLKDSQSKRCRECINKEWVHRGELCNKCHELEWEVKDRQDASYDYIESNRFELGEETIPGEPGWHTIDSGILSVNEIILLFRRGFVAEVHAPLAVLQQHLPALVQSHPIERVRATDKEPWAASGGSYLWHDRRYYTDSNQEDDLPGNLFELLGNTASGFYRNDPARLFPTAEAAHAALSVALLTLARR